MDLLHTNKFSIGSTQGFHLWKSSVTAIKRCSMLTTVYVLTVCLLTRSNYSMGQNTTKLKLFFEVRACSDRRWQVFQSLQLGAKRDCRSHPPGLRSWVISTQAKSPRSRSEATQLRFIGKQ